MCYKNARWVFVCKTDWKPWASMRPGLVPDYLLLLRLPMPDVLRETRGANSQHWETAQMRVEKTKASFRTLEAALA